MTTVRTFLIAFFVLTLWLPTPIFAKQWVKGIYVTQPTLERTATLKRLIKQAKAAGINTFVIDLSRLSKRYRKNIALVKAANLDYIARIVVFPSGGSHAQVTNPNFWQKKYKLVNEAVVLGADEIQLDYIRYHRSARTSKENAHNIHRVIKWYKENLAKSHVPLQIAVFGETSFGESKTIGQNVRLFANTIDTLAPMLYPSHYEPFQLHARQPYRTVKQSLDALQKQFDGQLPFKVYPYIELSNYRYPFSGQSRVHYISAQIKAVEDANVDGWYAWSAKNQYGYLFYVLRTFKTR